MAVRVVSEWLSSCSGCEISILNLGDVILDLIPAKLQLVHIPALVDSKYFGPNGDGTHLTLPECEVGIISGGVRNEEQKEVALELRKKCKFLIALGTCATNGGIPAQANAWDNADVLNKVFKGSITTPPAETPTQVVPKLLDRVYALDEIPGLKVDIYLPGCPPHPDWIAAAILALLDGKTEFKLPERSVCDTCQVIREKKAAGGANIKRSLTNATFEAEEPIQKMRCLMEQGFLCLGPVTLAGCAGKEGNPRCIDARMPCRGCFGPIKKTSNPLVDMMGALTSVGINPQSVPDRRLILNRFIGAHNKLRPLPQRPGMPGPR
ncbi:MAG: methyl viologen-reducing hydrogenase [Deltaproteobacteria bacterium]|nr:methyl viologen-reducing hydrogenase [Deltaproteobacteria bacterium]